MSAANRREYGTGAIYRLHEARYGCPPVVDGVRPDHTCRGLYAGALEVGQGRDRKRVILKAKTEGEVKRKIRKRKAEIDAGASAEVSSRTTVAQWADEWLGVTVRTLRPKSWRTDRGMVNNWIVPTIGKKRLGMLEPSDHRRIMDAMRAADRSGSMVRCHATFMTMLKAAKLEGHPVPERMLLVKAPAAKKSDRDAMETAQALALLPWAGELHHGSRFLAALLQGVRQAEALGMTWDSIDFERNTMTIDWQLQDLPYKVRYDTTSGFRIPDGYEARQLLGRWHLVRPKSEAGQRVIPMIPVMREALLRWREIQRTLIPKNPHGLVWPDLDGTPTQPPTDDEEWVALQCAAGVAHPRPRWFTIHEARHTTATVLLECGVDDATITAIMGHSSALSTKKYKHVRTERAAQALGLVAERLELR